MGVQNFSCRTDFGFAACTHSDDFAPRDAHFVASASTRKRRAGSLQSMRAALAPNE
jgi:hypothetical protein